MGVDLGPWGLVPIEMALTKVMLAIAVILDKKR